MNVPRWRFERVAATVAELHARPLPNVVSPTVWVAEPTNSAIVLGSTQTDATVDQQRARDLGLDIVRRRSGGGAVLVDRNCLWLDVVLPAGDHLWEDDLGRSFAWLGGVWQEALAALGHQTTVHDGAFERSPLSDLICFAGRGPGELLLDVQGRRPKVVGISQRRTRAGARFQCAAQLAWDPEPLIAVFAGAEALDPVAARSCGYGIGVGRQRAIDAFEHALVDL